MRNLALLLILPVLIGMGCATDPTTQIQTLNDVEALTQPDSSFDIDESVHLSTHHTYYATSNDGNNWTRTEEAIIKHASVPDLVELNQDLGPFPSSTQLVYFVDGTDGHGSEDLELGLIYSTNGGETWSDRLFTSMTGAPSGHVVVDPSLVKQPDGSLRLYYFDFPTNPVPGQTGPYEMHTALTTNGIDFTYEGLAFTFDTLITDPEVVLLEDTWYMYMMAHDLESIQVTTSQDPTKFEGAETVGVFGIPGAMVIQNQIHLFSCGQGGLEEYTSSNGVDFTLKQEKIAPMPPGVQCDPSPEPLADGGYGLVFKFIDMQDVTSPPEPTPPPVPPTH